MKERLKKLPLIKSKEKFGMIIVQKYDIFYKQLNNNEPKRLQEMQRTSLCILHVFLVSNF